MFNRVKKTSARVRFVVLLSLPAIAVALIALTPSSRAKVNQKLSSASVKKSLRPAFVPGEVLVRYRTERTAADKKHTTSMMSLDGTAIQMTVEDFAASKIIPGARKVRVAPELTLEAVQVLRQQPEVMYAEPNYILHSAVTPNDTLYNASLMWNLERIGAPQAWDSIRGSKNTADPPLFGNPQVVIAIIDGGIDTNHEDLQANIWTNPGDTADGVDNDGNGCIDDLHGCNFILASPNGTVFAGHNEETHASHVAGIAGAVGNNNKGISGVNWSVGLMSLKFLDEFGVEGDTDKAILAVQYAKLMRDKWLQSGGSQGANIRVLNASFGGGGFSQMFEEAINEANNSGILFVAAAGNVAIRSSIPNNDLVPFYPSSFSAPNIVSVAATNQGDALPATSDFTTHFGATSVDLAAPGVSILSTTPKCTLAVPDPDICAPDFPSPHNPNAYSYSIFSGTSMAAPHVSGAAALLWAKNSSLTVQQVKRILMFSGDVVPAVVDKTLSGRRLNINGSLQSLAESDEVPPGPAISFQINYQNGRTLNVGWLCNGDDDDFGGGPAALYELSFTDSAPGSTPIILKGVIPFSPNTTQTTNVTIPYRHTAGTLSLKPFDNRGNEGIARTLSVNVPLLVGDPYLPPAVGGQVALSTNTAELLELDADDVYVDFIFPSGFSFPFFGESHTEAKISSNGALYFGDAPVRPCPMNNPNCEPEADDVPSAPRALGGFKMIAGLWEDLTLETSLRPNAGVYVVHPNANSIIFRWQAKPCNFDLFLDECTGGTDVNFEIELRTDGTIKTRYGSGNTPLLPTVGIGGGNPDAYVVPTHTSDEFPINLTNAGEVTFTPRAPWSATTLASAQAEMKAWTIDGRTSAYVKLTFPDAGYRVANWGTPARVGNDFSVDATIEKFNGASAQANTSTAQIWDLGPLSAGNYTFTFKNSGTNVKTLNFTVGGAVVPNPIDTAREFVRWQYKDFLRREPDGPGWDHWEGEITQCSDPAKRFPGETEPQCVQRKRANTSAAFFLSPEFQNTGYFVLRVYRGSLGRMPHFGGSNPPDNVKDEFTRDAATVSQGIVVNDQLDPAVINANKQAFVEAFVTRPEFRTIYDPLNDTQYVDRLFQTTGVTPTSGERQALITEAGAPNGRASVLFKVVDGTTTIANGALVFNTPYGKAFYDNLFNAAFVQMEYFGYLLRDPDEAGYAFWLGKLNQFGNWVDAQMVLAFIKSPEYRSRFGQP